MSDTIFALSSGSAPAAIGIIRISGEAAESALRTIAGRLPVARRATYLRLHDQAGEVLDNALALWFPGPASATGDDLAELHCHGGRAVLSAVLSALSALPGLRAAEPGEFTRRAFLNGRIDLAEAEGLADLLSAETELQRRSALSLAGGAFSRQVGSWRERLLAASARVEAALDFADEDDVEPRQESAIAEPLAALQREIAGWLAQPRAAILREGFKVVLAGPPNVGKSTLFNALVENDAAITAPTAGTTRDLLTQPCAIMGIPFVFADTAGLRDHTVDPIEQMGIAKAQVAVSDADLVLWLGPQGMGPSACWEIEGRADVADRLRKSAARHRVSAITGEGLEELRVDLAAVAGGRMPKPGKVALSGRQASILADVGRHLAAACGTEDMLIIGENLRIARGHFDALIGRTATEDMLTALFARFCIGK